MDSATLRWLCLELVEAPFAICTVSIGCQVEQFDLIRTRESMSLVNASAMGGS